MKSVQQTKMTAAEEQVVTEIESYLVTRGDRIATDLGLLEFRRRGKKLVAMIAGATYEVLVVVEANDNAKGGK